MGRPKASERLTAFGGLEDGLLVLGLRALSDPVRLRIVRLLSHREQCICHLTEEFGLSQASISHHMAILKRAGLVEDRRDARWTYYSLSPQSVSILRSSIDTLLDATQAERAPEACCDPELVPRRGCSQGACSPTPPASADGLVRLPET